MPHISTIAALATARGISGIGIIRLSGPDSWAIAARLTEGQPPLVDRTANLRRILKSSTGEVLDHGIVLPMRGPHSYTGEDTVELQLHGSPLLLDSVLDACLELGAEPAGPGEFTFRALLAGKLSLLQAEAVRDLVDAGSDEELSLARKSLFTDASQPFRECPESDHEIPCLSGGACSTFLISSQRRTRRVLCEQPGTLQERRTRRSRSSSRTRRQPSGCDHGVTVVIAGAPNVGKSSLMNALLKYPRVIVSDIPGTTRDSVAGGDPSGTTPGHPGRHGRHQAQLRLDVIDRLAGEQTAQSLERADIVLIVLDAETGLQPHERDLLRSIRSLPHIVAVNKVDTGPVPVGLAAEVGEPVLGISATEGTELEELTCRLARLVEAAAGPVTARQMVTHRQAAELTTADRALGDFMNSAATAPADVLAYLVGEAREAMQTVAGRTHLPRRDSRNRLQHLLYRQVACG